MDNRPRVAQLSTPSTWRGGERQALWLAEGLRDGHGVESLFFAPEDSALASRAREAGFTVRAWPGKRAWNPLNWPAFRRALREENAVLVHAHDGHAVQWARRAGRPSVCTRRVDFPIRGKRAYRSMDRMIAISEAVRGECLRAGVADERLRVVHDGIDLDHARGLENGKRALPPREAIRDALAAECCPSKKRRLFLLNVASLTDHKDHATLLDAMPAVLTKHPNAHLLLAGDGELREELVSRAKRLGMDDDVSFLGFRDDVPALLSAADVYVSSSHMEGLGTSIMDAMAAGCAVAATRAGGVPELIDDGKDGRLMAAGDASALSTVLLELLGNQRLREHYGRLAAARAERQFGREAMVAGTLAVYRDLLPT